LKYQSRRKGVFPAGEEEEGASHEERLGQRGERLRVKTPVSKNGRKKEDIERKINISKVLLDWGGGRAPNRKKKKSIAEGRGGRQKTGS